MSDLPAPTVVLTEEQIAFFHREGYLMIDQITADEEVAYLQKTYDRILEQRVGHDVGTVGC